MGIFGAVSISFSTLGFYLGVRKGGVAGGAQLENDPLEDTAIEVIEGSAGKCIKN